MNALPESPSLLYSMPLNVVGGFAGGCLMGAVIGAPVVLTGAVYAVSAVANHAINAAIKYLGKKYEWNISSALLVKAAANAILVAAVAVTFVALGILGSTGAAVFGILGVGGVLGGFGVAYAARREELNPEGPKTFRDAAPRMFA